MNTQKINLLYYIEVTIEYVGCGFAIAETYNVSFSIGGERSGDIGYVIVGSRRLSIEGYESSCGKRCG